MKIAFIASYDELADLVIEISKEMNLNIDAFTGNYDDAGILAKQLELDGYDILISRGTAYEYIKKSVNIPIVNCHITALDILYALSDALEDLRNERKIALILPKNLVLEGDKISKLFNIELLYLASYTEIEEINTMVQEAVDRGAEVIVGGTYSVEYANNLGKKTILLKTSVETLRQAINNAVEIYNLSMKQMMEAERLNNILSFSYEGIVVADNNGIITYFNPTAEKIFNIEYKDIIGKKADEFNHTTKLIEVVQTGIPQLSQIQKVNNNTILINRIPIMVKNRVEGVVATFQEISKIQDYEKKIRSELHKKGLVANYTFFDYKGENKEVKELLEKAKIYANTDSAVLIEGESGTGKEILAQSIHNASNRSNNPFVAINCSAIPENLLESELFGYEEGAFTGAKKGGKIGLFELAHTGTIFLDEISSIPLNLQSRLLRVLQEREVWRLGSDRSIKIDVRVIASSNINLFEAVNKGDFRKDLYFRLNVLKLGTLPLRKRKDDIEILFSYFLNKYSDNTISINKNLIAKLKDYNWPGNVRELQNFVLRISYLNEHISIASIFEELTENNSSNQNISIDEDSIIIKKGTKKEMEIQILRTLYDEYEQNSTLLAEKLGISRTTLWKKLKN